MGSKRHHLHSGLLYNIKHEQEANDGERLAAKGETLAMVSGPLQQQSANKQTQMLPHDKVNVCNVFSEMFNK